MIFSEIESGHSVEGQAIKAFKNNIQGDKYIYLLAGTHGDEIEGVYVLSQIFGWLKEQRVEDPAPMVVIPIFNVDGYRDHSRLNSHGVDLNRNLKTQDWTEEFKKPKNYPGTQAMSEPETKYLDKLFQEYPPGIILSFHSGKPSINYNGGCESIAKFVGAYNQYNMNDNDSDLHPGSLTKYIDEKYQASCMHYVCPKLGEKSLKEIWSENETAFQKLFSSDILNCSL